MQCVEPVKALSNEFLAAKLGVDTATNEPFTALRDSMFGDGPNWLSQGASFLVAAPCFHKCREGLLRRHRSTVGLLVFVFSFSTTSDGKCVGFQEATREYQRSSYMLLLFMDYKSLKKKRDFLAVLFRPSDFVLPSSCLVGAVYSSIF
jgi:hypothetical protein